MKLKKKKKIRNYFVKVVFLLVRLSYTLEIAKNLIFKTLLSLIIMIFTLNLSAVYLQKLTFLMEETLKYIQELLENKEYSFEISELAKYFEENTEFSEDDQVL